MSGMLVPILFTAVAAGFAISAHKVIHRGMRGITPLAVFYASWILSGALYLWNPLKLSPISSSTLIAIAVALTCTTMGYAMVVLASPNSTVMADNRVELAKTAALALGLIGGAIFIIYLAASGLAAGGLGALGEGIQAIRFNLGRGEIPLGFYYFYFLVPLVPLCALLFRVTKRHRYLVLLSVAGLLLLATSGRTNVFQALIWASVCWFAWKASRFDFRRILGLVGFALLAVIIFSLVGNAVGKTYENSRLSDSLGPQAPVPKTLALPILYVSGPIPALEMVLRSPSEYAMGANSATQVAELVAFVQPSIARPQRIQDFVSIPYPFNVSTFISPLYRDFGWLGIPAGSILLGMILGMATVFWRRYPSIWSCMAMGLASVVAASSSGDAVWTSKSLAASIIVILILHALSRRGRKPLGGMKCEESRSFSQP